MNNKFLAADQSSEYFKAWQYFIAISMAKEVIFSVFSEVVAYSTVKFLQLTFPCI